MSDERNTVGYVRASVEDPGTLEEQAASVEAVAAEKGLTVVAVIAEMQARSEQQARSLRAKAAWESRRQRQADEQETRNPRSASRFSGAMSSLLAPCYEAGAGAGRSGTAGVGSLP